MNNKLLLYTSALIFIASINASQIQKTTQEQVTQIATLLEDKYKICSLAHEAHKTSSPNAESAKKELQACYGDIFDTVQQATIVLDTLQKTTTPAETCTLELINRAKQIFHDPEITTCDYTKIHSIMTALSQTNLAYEFWHVARQNEKVKPTI